jgi:hypothetical protein
MRKIILLVFLASLSLIAEASDFTVIGMDSSGNETHGQIQESDYKKLINFEMQQSDELLDHQVIMNPNFRNKLMLKTVMIGFGMNGNLKLGPYAIGAAVNHQFYYDIIR